MLADLKNYDKDRVSLDECLELMAFARAFKAEFAHYGDEVPEWLEHQMNALDKDILSRVGDKLQYRLRELDQADKADRSSSERRQDRQVERDRLLARMGKTPVSQ